MEDLGVHNRVVERLFQQLYNQRIIDNVDRGVYVEYMIEAALQDFDPAWECMPGWSMWDLEHSVSKARIEVKQSAKLQTWSRGSTGRASSPSFRIAPTKWYWDNATGVSVETEPQRWADLYIFAYHPEDNEGVADHRRPDQWEFYLVPEGELLPSKKNINLNPVRDIGRRCRFGTIARDVTRAIAELPRLKADNPI